MTLIEDGNSNGIVSRNANKGSAAVLKLLELVCFFKCSANSFNVIYLSFNIPEQSLTILCLVLHYYSFNDDDILTTFLATGTFSGFVILFITIFCGMY